MKAKIAAVVALLVAGLGWLVEELATHVGEETGKAVVQGWHNGEIQKRYEDVATQLNQKTPMDVGNGIRLDSIDAKNMTLTYHYTALNVPNDIEAAGQAVKAQAHAKYCDGSTTFKSDGVAMVMRYVDSSGKPIYEYRIGPDDC